MKKIFSEKTLHILIFLLVAIQPIIDLDYLFYDFLDQFGLPRFATIVRFLIVPALIFWSFILRERKKKGVALFTIIYGAISLVYFYLHTNQAQELAVSLHFTDNFYFSVFQELTYILTLALPYGVMYFCYHEHFSSTELKHMVFWLSGIISVPILLGDLFVFGQSTYEGYTVANFFSWFTDIYSWYKPRQLASKFFFNEGNTIGILLFMILPLLYYFLRSGDKKDRKTAGILIIIQSIAMQCLATRVATYGAVIVPVMYLVLGIIDRLLFSKEKLAKSFLILCIGCAAVFGAMLQRTPAVQNQLVDSANDLALLHNGMADAGKEALANADDLEWGSDSWRNYYVFMFETYGINARYIQSVPSVYYTEYYSYQYDPEFWTRVCLEIDVYDRVNGRQVENIFFNYKYQNLSQTERILGMGYSTFMNGSIVLERDFAQQVYTLGYLGEFLFVMPWIFVVLYGFIMFIRYFKKLVNLENVTLALSLGLGLGAAYMSGHVLDQFLTTVFMAFITAILLNKVHDAREKKDA